MSCYYPDGSPSAQNDIPCDTSGYGPCCPDLWQCEINGLCFLDGVGEYGRWTCTDQTWQSSSCPQICTHSIFGLMLARTEMKLTEDVDLTADGPETVNECTSGSYCCDSYRPELFGGTACCEAGAPRFSLAALPLLPDGGAIVPSAAPTPYMIDTTQSTPALSSTAAQPTSSSNLPPPPPSSSSTAAQPSSTPPSSIIPSHIPTSTFQTSSTPLPSSTTPFSTPTSTPQTPSTSITLIKVTSGSSLSTVGSSSPSISVTQVVTSNGSQSTVHSSATSNVAEPGSSLSKTNHPNLGLDVGIPVGVCLPLLAALTTFLWYWRRKRSRLSTSPPRFLQADFIPADPKSVISSPFPHSPGTAPPDSHGSSTLVGAQNQHPQFAELQGSPTAGMLRNSRGSEFTRNAETGATTSPRQSGLPAMSEGGVGHTIAAELPATTSAYRPYRPPGWVDSQNG